MRVAIVGVGLIGGSIGMAARHRVGATVYGYDPDAEVLRAALERGAIDEMASDITAAVHHAEVVFVAVPVGVLGQVVSKTLQAAPGNCVISDVGSTKRVVGDVGEDERFVGGHPLAGAETAGVEHAREDLFEGATWYLTPTGTTAGVLYERLHRVLVGFGAQPVATDGHTHDEMMACVSHLPHVLANVLVTQTRQALDVQEHPLSIGPSFRDATRVAGANSGIWTDIYLSNRDALIAGIDGTVHQLQQVREKLAARDASAIRAWNEEARADRETLLGSGLAGGEVHELRVSVPNRPGVIADIALALGRSGVNIVDMVLSPSRDNRQGVVALWVRGDEYVTRAQALIAELGFPIARI